MSLRQRWIETCSTFNIKQEIVDGYWDKIESMYTEKHRRYHTLNHLIDMIKHLDNVRGQLIRPELVALAVFFHDIVYEPKEKDNEEKSAAMFLEFAKHFRFEDNEFGTDITTVFDWIIETKKHETQVHRTPGGFGREDLHFFLDMDMAILGCPDTVYRKYADDIRTEYQHIPDPLFRAGRAKILRSFLEVPNIYATEIFRTRFENRARENIKGEILRLEE